MDRLSRSANMVIPSHTFDPVVPEPYHPQAFEKAMVFIDGSNLFNRLNELKLRVPSFYLLASVSAGRRQLVRTCLYTSEDKLKKAKDVHSESSFDNCRIVLGAGVVRSDGSIKEKGVDAQLVADLVYHAAVKNFQFAAEPEQRNRPHENNSLCSKSNQYGARFH